VRPWQQRQQRYVIFGRKRKAALLIPIEAKLANMRSNLAHSPTGCQRLVCREARELISKLHLAQQAWNLALVIELTRLHKACQGDVAMGRGILLWLLGVPIPVIIIFLLIFIIRVGI
jgi:hypothetical protein